MPIQPMRLRAQATLPKGHGWAFEPKWDGFRAIAWSGGRLDSRRKRPLLHYFPELEAALADLPPETVLDGEILVPIEGVSDFAALQQRLNLSAARSRELARAIPARFAAFDLLALHGQDYMDHPYEDRHEALARLQLPPPWVTTPNTTDRTLAESWLTDLLATGCEGVVAKPLRGRYEPGRDRWVKVKRRHTIDTVVGGVRLTPSGGRFDALLLGLYDAGGQLDYVGAARNFPDPDRAGILRQFRALQTDSSFTGRSPDHERTWGHRRGPWFPVRPIVVAEVSADQIAGQVFRHGARFERWRTDKPPAECTRDQLVVVPE